MGTDQGDLSGARPPRPATRVRAPSPIDAQRQPVVLTRAVRAWSFACLSGLLGLVTAARLRSTLREAPWRTGELELSGPRQGMLHTEGAAQPQTLELEARTSTLGEQGARLPVEYCQGESRLLLSPPGRTRLIRTWPVTQERARTEGAADD